MKNVQVNIEACLSYMVVVHVPVLQAEDCVDFILKNF